MELFSEETRGEHILDKKALSSTLKYDLENTNIETISIKNVVNEENSPLKKECEYKEFYVVELILNDLQVPKEFLQKLDTNIFFPTLYILKYKNIYNYIISIKEQKDNHLKILRVFDRGWGNKIEDYSLNLFSIKSIMKQLLRMITSVKFEASQSFKEYTSILIKNKRCFGLDNFIINKGHSSFLQINDSIKILGEKDWDEYTTDILKKIIVCCFTDETMDSLLEKLKECMYQQCISKLKNKALIPYLRPTLSNYKLNCIIEDLIQTKHGTTVKLENNRFKCYFTQATININSVYNRLYSVK